ncbi:hypothetical protein [Lysinibacillus fusiformis]|uniref:hypothetical protein n=1 Tax=Lysinibacillus fusiformis TaxID=28031 RepID=UPI003AB0C6E0
MNYETSPINLFHLSNYLLHRKNDQSMEETSIYYMGRKLDNDDNYDGHHISFYFVVELVEKAVSMGEEGNIKKL